VWLAAHLWEVTIPAGIVAGRESPSSQEPRGSGIPGLATCPDLLSLQFPGGGFRGFCPPMSSAALRELSFGVGREATPILPCTLRS
jgi:hypothetical protein